MYKCITGIHRTLDRWFRYLAKLNQREEVAGAGNENNAQWWYKRKKSQQTVFTCNFHTVRARHRVSTWRINLPAFLGK